MVIEEKHQRTPKVGTILNGLDSYLENQRSMYRCPEADASESDSYGVNVCVHRLMEEPKKIMMADAYTAVLEYDSLDLVQWKEDIAPRHGGTLNVLYYDGRVERARPNEINPYDVDSGETIRSTLWRPERGDCSSGTGCTSEAGLSATYFSPGNNFTGASYQRNDTTLHLPFGAYGYGPGYTDCATYPMWCEQKPYNVTGFIPNATSSNSQIGSAIWTGRIKAPTTDTYTFYLSCDNEAWFYINGTEVVHRNTGGAVGVNQSTTGTFSLQADQWVDVELRLVEFGVGSPTHVSVKWSSSSISYDAIPTENMCGG